MPLSPKSVTTRAFLGRRLHQLRKLLFPALRHPDALGRSEAEAGVDLLYRFILGQSADERGRRLYLRLIREEGVKLREVAVEMAASDEFQARLKSALGTPSSDPTDVSPPRDTFVDVRALSDTLTVDELARTADDYYRNTLEFADRYLAKPFDDPHDTPDLLGSFAHLLGGLRIAPGMAVLDFGAGAGSTTYLLTQLGCAVTALDVSPTALELAKRRFARLPPVGRQPEPRFLTFDGRRVDLPDASVESNRLLRCLPPRAQSRCGNERAGSRAPSRRHCGLFRAGTESFKGGQVAVQMKNYVAFENDVIMADIWRWAQAAGFLGLELAVFSTESHRVSLQEFDDLLAGGDALDAYDAKLRAFLSGHQTFSSERAVTLPRTAASATASGRRLPFIWSAQKSTQANRFVARRRSRTSEPQCGFPEERQWAE